MELCDIVVLKGANRPVALGFKTVDIRHSLTMGERPEAPASGSVHQ
jgi:hypothetical protein